MKDESNTSLLQAEVLREQRVWRERVLNGFGLATLATCLFATVWYGLIIREAPPLVPVLVATTITVSVALLLRSLPFLVRAFLVIGALHVTCGVALAIAGLAPNAFVGLALAAVGSALLLGGRAGLVSVALSAFTMLSVSLAHRSAWLDRLPAWREQLDSSIFANAVRMTSLFVLLSTTGVIGISYLFGRSQRLLVEKTQSYQALREEQLEKERIAHDLALREGAFQKARELEILGRLAGSMAHDFNNSLLVIWAALDEIEQSGKQSEPVAAAAAAIRVAANQAAATTRQLRAFGPMAPRSPGALALTPVLEKTRTMLARVLPRNIELAVDNQVEVTVRADEGEMLRALTNLALNARDAMREGGRLTLRVRPLRSAEAPAVGRAEAFAAVEVEDNGSGMSEEVKARLFEPFFTTKASSGTGLGLASVRDIVEREGGRVTVASELGRGTTISLFWPTLERVVEKAISREPLRAAHGIVVLLVEDEPAVRMAISRGLARAGMTVVEAEDGAAGLSELRRHTTRIDVLCTDCVMHGTPVRQLINGFRELHHGSVIVCSGYAPDDTGLSPDLFDDFLSKPFTGEELAERIRKVLGQSSSLAPP